MAHSYGYHASGDIFCNGSQQERLGSYTKGDIVGAGVSHKAEESLIFFTCGPHSRRTFQSILPRVDVLMGVMCMVASNASSSARAQDELSTPSMMFSYTCAPLMAQ
jgi:hypothetical protein